MGIMRSFGAKLTGRKINAVSERIGTVSDRIPMKTRASVIGEDHVSLVRVGNGKEPIFGVECKDGAICLDHLKGVFRDGEVLDASVEGGCLYLTKGKNSYRFPLTNYYETEPIYPNLKASTEFRMDPCKISDRYDRKRLKDGYAKLIADYDGNGRKIVRAFLYGPGADLIDVVVLASTWTGEPSASRIPMDYLKDIDVFGKEVTIRMSTDYPMELITSDTVDSSYLVAPRIFTEDDMDFVMKETEKEKGWIESHNRKRIGRFTP